MSLSSENMMKLMAYADGELEGDERLEAEKLLATDPDSVRFVQQLGGLGELVELGYAAGPGKAVAKFDIADSVMTLAKPAVQGAKVSSLAAARQKKNGSGAKVGVAIVAVLALAASVFLVAQHRNDETPMAKGPAVRETAQTAVQPAPATTVASVASGTTGGSSGAGVDVSTVNSPGSSVSVFYLPTANELSTSVVVWVDETGEK
jgi:anti-sigma factor RsiW